MPQFAANLSFLYNELPFSERFEAAAKDGFKAVEFLFPYEWPAADIKTRLDAHGLHMALFNAPPGGSDTVAFNQAWAAGERGTACVPGREAEFRAGVLAALQYAAVLSCTRVHVLAGLVPLAGSRAAAQDCYINNLRWACALAAEQGVNIMVEPINTRNVPGYFLNRQDHAHEILDAVDAPNLQVQMDLFHCQIVEGDVATKIRQYLPTGRVGHFQIASAPERHEPGSGELNYDYLFKLIDEVATQCGWQGWVGCEYQPARGAVAGGTSAGLGWKQAYA